MSTRTPKNFLTIATAVSVAVVGYVAVEWYRTHRRQLAAKESRADRQLAQLGDSPAATKFKAAATKMRPIFGSLSEGEQLILYALYKQALFGDAPPSFRPTPSGGLDEHAKYSSWLHLKGMERAEAMERYSIAAEDIEQRRARGVVEEADDLLQGFSHAVSRPAVDDGGVDAQAKDPASQLLKAAGEGQWKQLQVVLAQSSNAAALINHCDESGQTALHLAADKGHVECVQKLLEHGANVNAIDRDGISVLQAAVIAGEVEICRLLLEKGANPDQADMDGDTPRSCAADDGDEAMLLLFGKTFGTAGVVW